MTLYVPGQPTITVEALPATPDAATELVDFLAAGWDEWYNGQLDAQLDVPSIATPGHDDHIARVLEELRDPTSTHVVARDDRLGGTIVGLAWLIGKPGGVILEEWLVSPGNYRGSDIGPAVLAFALRKRRTAVTPNSRLSLEVYRESPVVSLYGDDDMWGLDVVGEVSYAHVGSGVPQLKMAGIAEGMLRWLNQKSRLVEGRRGS